MTRTSSPSPPTLASASYRARLAKLVGGAIRSGYAPLLDALPRLAAAMEAQRTDSARRGDASPVDEASKLAGRAAKEFGSGFAKQVRAEVKRASENVAAHSKGQLRRKLDEHPDERIRARKLTDGPKLSPIIEGFAAENVALITGISPQLASQVQALVVQGLTSGVPHERLARQIRDRLDVSARRAEMIAVDQVGKLNGQLSAQRAQDLGVTHFFWRTLDDERVRGNPDGKYPDAKPSHWDRDDKRYAYADLPKGRNGEPEMPGTAINCRCYADPDLSTLLQPGAPSGDGVEVQAAPVPAARSVDDLEDDAARMMAEVEEMLARQQAEIEKNMRAAAPAPPLQDEQLEDPVQEAQAQSLVAQLASAPPAAAETALARFRRWKRRGQQVRGDQLRDDYSPDQPRAPDGRFGEVAGERDLASERAASKRERQAARAARAASARAEATRQGRSMLPDQWEGWKREASQQAEEAEYEIESATDDMRDAGNDEEREAARARLVAASDARAVARARESAFHDLIENSQMAPEPDDEPEPSDEYDDPTIRAMHGSTHRRARGYEPLPPDVVAAHAAALAAVDAEAERGMATTSHPRVSISEDWAGRSVGTGSLPDGVTVEELSHAFAPPDGFTATIDSVSDREISMTFQDANGKDVGKLVRNFRPNGEIHHSLFVLNKDARGAGFADEVLASSIVRYEKIGIKKVTVDAAWLGRYKWATLGFRFDDKDSPAGYDRGEVEKQVERFLFANVESEETKQQVRDMLDEPWNLARFTDGNEYEVEFKSGPNRDDRSSGKFHLGKALLLQDKMPTWTGALDVDRDNEGYLHALSKLKVGAL